LYCSRSQQASISAANQRVSLLDKSAIKQFLDQPQLGEPVFGFPHVRRYAKVARMRVGVENGANPATLINRRYEMYLNDRPRRLRFGLARNVPVPCERGLERRRYGRPLVVRAALVALLARPVATTVLGQDAVRMSMAGSAAAQARQNAMSTPGYYNLQLGPTYWRFSSGIGLGYEDNVTLTSSTKEGDFVYSPSLDAHLLWPITPLQSLNLTIGGGYSGYAEHSELNRAYITPNSELSFNIYAGDFVVNLHDRFSISENSYQDPTLAASGSYSQFQNSAGLLVTWDLNKLIVNAAYDHGDNFELTGGLGEAAQTQDIVSTSAMFALKPGTSLGIEFGGAQLHYSYATTNVPYTGALEWNAGPVFQAPITEYLTIMADAGYVVNSPQGGELSTARQFGSYYGTVQITHRLNKIVQYTVSGGRGLNTSYFGGATDSYMASLSATWSLIRKVSLDTTFNYQYGSQVGVSGGETFDQYGLSIQLNRALSKKSTIGLGYTYYQRGSNLQGRDYALNVVMLNLAYQF
jgi:hypothetical protein